MALPATPRLIVATSLLARPVAVATPVLQVLERTHWRHPRAKPLLKVGTEGIVVPRRLTVQVRQLVLPGVFKPILVRFVSVAQLHDANIQKAFAPLLLKGLFPHHALLPHALHQQQRCFFAPIRRRLVIVVMDGDVLGVCALRRNEPDRVRRRRGGGLLLLRPGAPAYALVRLKGLLRRQPLSGATLHWKSPLHVPAYSAGGAGRDAIDVTDPWNGQQLA